MRRASILAILVFTGHGSSFAQTHPSQKADPDRLGLSCSQILQMTSSDWVTHFNEKIAEQQDASRPAALRAIAVYGQCYDARTNRLAAALGKSGKGPLMGARGDFRDFDAALTDFTAKTLAAAEPPPDTVKAAYAALYEKQFSYQFYQGFERKPLKATPVAAPPPPSAAIAKPAPATADTSKSAPPTANSAAPTSPATDVNDPFTQAKNHFGGLLGNLPEDKMHEVHAAFGKLFARSAIGQGMKLELYRYAIFLLEPPSATPFSPPPF